MTDQMTDDPLPRVLSAAIIQALEGPALTAAAWRLGCAPATVLAYAWGEKDIRCYTRAGDRWEPHQHLGQALAVFTLARDRGWSTCLSWFGDDRQYGEAWIGTEGHVAWHVRWQTPDEEASAVLRCVVLAVAAMQ